MGCVYLLTSPTGKRYVGQTQRGDVAIRWGQHRCLRNHRPLSRAIAKHGWDAFQKEIVFETDDRLVLNAKEVELIALYDCMAPNGYNLTAGGDGVVRRVWTQAQRDRQSAHFRGRVVSEETRAKLRAAHARNPRGCPMEGKKHSVESLAKMAASQRLRPPPSPETRAKLSLAHRGHAVSEETRAKLRWSASNQPQDVKDRIAEGMRRVWAERRANG